jgi:Mn2+/Fe2+ NRAMP family transporter
MPHNLFLHSSLCKNRRIGSRQARRQHSDGAVSMHTAPKGSGNLEESTAPPSTLARSATPSPARLDDVGIHEIQDDTNDANSAPQRAPVDAAIAAAIAEPVIESAYSVQCRSSTDQLLAVESPVETDFDADLDLDSITSTIRFSSLDGFIALTLAFFINATILIVGASAFWARGKTDVAELQDAYASLNEYIGNGTGTAFALALLASGQSSTITGTLATLVTLLII